MTPVVDAVLKKNPNVRVIYKEFPIRGPMSELAARAALSANKQGKYGEFSHALLAVNQPLTEEIIFNAAKQSGVNVSQLKKDMHSKLINKQLNGNYELAKSLKLFATPTFYVSKTSANSLTEIASSVGSMSQADLQGMIDRAAQ